MSPFFQRQHNIPASVNKAEPSNILLEIKLFKSFMNCWRGPILRMLLILSQGLRVTSSQRVKPRMQIGEHCRKVGFTHEKCRS